MYWQEEQTTGESYDTVDLTFRVNAASIPADHAQILFDALLDLLPNFADMPNFALHPVRVPAEGNGWIRDAQEYLILSKRARLGLRIPKESARTVTEVLTGKSFELGGSKLRLTHPMTKDLSSHCSLIAYNVVGSPGLADNEFLTSAADDIKEMGVKIKKMISGKSHNINSSEGMLFTRSLMLDSLELEESLKLQSLGIGKYQHLGCGLFVPHKRFEN